METENTNDELGDRPLTEQEARHCGALQTLFHGLLEEYPKALRQGRVKEWCTVMRSIADFYDSDT